MYEVKRGLATIAVWCIRLFKTVFQISDGCCRYTPTCSDYAREALEKKPFIIALLLIGKRLLSCHPFHKGGFDPVPEKSITLKG
jgi:putative membrane protein insertion efficiency factor